MKIVSELKLFEGDVANPLTEWSEDLSALVQKSFVDVLELHGLDENDKEVTRQALPLASAHATVCRR